MREAPVQATPWRLALPKRSTLIACGLAINALYWIVRIGAEWISEGLFYRIGVDWSRFWGATRAFVHLGPAAGYNLSAIAAQMRPLAAYYGPQAGFVRALEPLSVANLQVGPAPYPPIFLALFAPFTWLPPAYGFLAWTAINAAIAAYVVARLSTRLRDEHPWVVPFSLLTFYPLITALHDGQMVILLLAALYLAYDAFERGQDLRAGLWLGLFVLKPQYAPVIVLVLLGKRRWSAIVGIGLTGLVVAAASLAVGGLGGCLAYVRMLLDDYPNYAGALAIDPTLMISWRALVINLLPGLGSAAGLVLMGLLSLASLTVLPVVWRGSWQPRSPRFARQMTATMIVTLLVAYHSQLHGAVLLMVPGVVMLACAGEHDLVRRLVPWLLFAPPFGEGLSLLLLHNHTLVPMLYLTLMVIALGAILAEERRPAGLAAAEIR